MSSSSMLEQEHDRSPPEMVTMASADEPQPQLLGLGDPEAGRSDMATIVTGGAGDEEKVMGAVVPLDVDVVLVDSPWGFLLAPQPLSIMKQDEVSAPPPPPHAAPSSTKQCVQCGATETPQWRMQPMGMGALCNACRIRLRPAEALREPVHVHVHLPPPATATTMVVSKSPADGWISKAWKVLKLRKKKKHGGEKQHQPLEPGAGDGMEQHLPPPPAQALAGGDEPAMGEPHPMDQLLLDAIDGLPETHIVYGVGGDLPMGDPSSLDEFLFNGPAAPPLIDDDDGNNEDMAD